MRYLLFFFFIAFLCQSFSAVSAEKQRIYLYTYHDKPPFISSKQNKQGLYYDLANALSEASTKYNFRTAYVPRKRLDYMLEEKTLDGIVLGAIPAWFGDKDEKRYAWSAGFYFDRDEFVSLKNTPFEYQSIDSLDNKRLGSVAGYYYHGINQSVKEGKLARLDTIGELQVLELIEKKRVDFGLVSQSVFKYLLKNGKIVDHFHLSALPHDQFERRAFAPNELKAELDAFNQSLNQLIATGKFQTIVSRYE